MILTSHILNCDISPNNMITVHDIYHVCVSALATEQCLCAATARVFTHIPRPHLPKTSHPRVIYHPIIPDRFVDVVSVHLCSFVVVSETLQMLYRNPPHRRVSLTHGRATKTHDETIVMCKS